MEKITRDIICKIFLENFSPLAKIVTDRLITFAEPKSRPHHIHEYELTHTSLYAAASIGLKKDDIIDILNKYSKNLTVPKQVEEDIQECFKKYGRAKLIL